MKEKLAFTEEQLKQLRALNESVLSTYKLLAGGKDVKISYRCVIETIVNMANDLYSFGYNAYYPGIVYSEELEPLSIRDFWGTKETSPIDVEIDAVYIFLKALEQTGYADMLFSTSCILAAFPEYNLEEARGFVLNWAETYQWEDFSIYENEISQYVEKINELKKGGIV